MTITALQSPLVPKAISFLASEVNFDRIAVLSSIAEAGFYSTIQAGTLQMNKTKARVYEFSVAYIHQLQSLFNLANAGITYYYAKKLDNFLLEKYSVSVLDKTMSYLFLFFSILTVISIREGAIPFKEKWHALWDKPNGNNNVVIEKATTTQQKIAKFLHISKILAGLAVTYFEKNYFWFALSLFGTAYSLRKNFQLTWLRFSQEFNRANRITVTYNMLALPVEKWVEDCAICLTGGMETPQASEDNDSPPDIAFCTKHVFHKDCISQSVAAKNTMFIGNSQPDGWITRHYENGRYTHTTHQYAIDIPLTNVFQCPLCNEVPFQNYIDVKISRDEGTWFAGVNILRPSKQALFEKLYASYNMVQMGLNYLQTYPEFASTIFTMQKVLLVADVIGYAFTVKYLYENIKRKFEIKKSTLDALTVLSIVAAAVISYYATFSISKLVQPNISLNDMVAGLGKQSDGLSMDWHVTDIHRLMQCVYINKMIALFALSFFSEQKWINRLSASSQFLSLLGLIQLQWIKCVQTLTYPLKKVVETGGSLEGIDWRKLTTLKIESAFMLDPTCKTVSSYLQNVVKSIYDSSAKIIDGSRWSDYLVTNITNTGREYKHYYNVFLKENLLPAWTLAKDITMSALGTSFGESTVNIKYA